MTITKLTGRKKYVQTAKEIMENDYPELLEKANLIVKELIKAQNMVVAMLPACKKQLPQTFEELKEQQAQRVLSDYIRLRLLYEFAEELWKRIDNQCRELARKNKYEDCYGEDIETKLRHTLDTVESFPFEESANDSVKGLQMFKERFIQGMYVAAFGCLEFHDIIEIIDNHGLQDKKLWNDALNDSYPTCSNIGELLPDNEM